MTLRRYLRTVLGAEETHRPQRARGPKHRRVSDLEAQPDPFRCRRVRLGHLGRDTKIKAYSVRGDHEADYADLLTVGSFSW